jgi:hypothetical protein
VAEYSCGGEGKWQHIFQIYSDSGPYSNAQRESPSPDVEVGGGFGLHFPLKETIFFLKVLEAAGGIT